MLKPTHSKATPHPSQAGGWGRGLASYLVAAVCLFWVFHNIDLGPLWRGIIHINGWLMALSVVLQFVAYFCVAWEWQLLLAPVGTLPLRKAVQAVFAGRFANDALPFQLGYLVRAALAARWMNVGVLSVFPSLIVERLWDGVWIATGVGLIALLLPLPAEALRAADVLGFIALGGTAMTVWVVLRHSRKSLADQVQKDFKWKPLRWFQRTVRHLADGMKNLGRPGLLVTVSGLSLLTLAIRGVAFLEMLRAYGLHLPVAVGLAVFLTGYVGICVPSTPAGTGMFQLFVVAGLTFFGIGKSAAAGFALTAFVAITVPLAVAGFFAFAQSGMRLKQVRRGMGWGEKVRNSESEIEKESGAGQNS